MQRVVFILTVGLMSLVVSQSAQAAVGTYDFTGGDASFPTAPNATFSPFTRANVAGGTVTGWFASGQWNNTGTIDTTEYVQFTLTPNSGYYLSLQNITFDNIIDTGNKGPKNGRVEIFLGTGLASMGSLTFTPSTTSANINFNFADFTTLNNEGVTIRFYGWNALNSGNDAQLNFDNVVINGSVNPVPEPVNVALGIFGGVFLVVIAGRSQPVRDRVQRFRAAVVQWVDAV